MGCLRGSKFTCILSLSRGPGPGGPAPSSLGTSEQLLGGGCRGDDSLFV